MIQPHATNVMAAQKPSFITIAQFKEQFQVSSMAVIKNPNTNKLFVSASTATGSKNFNCKQAINKTLPMRFMLPVEANGDLTQYVLVNVDESKLVDNTQFTL